MGQDRVYRGTLGGCGVSDGTLLYIVAKFVGEVLWVRW